MNYDKLTKEEIIKILNDTLGYIDKQEKEIERLNNELANIKKFKNSILEELEKRTSEVNKLKNRKRGKMKEELKEFGISLEDIEESNKLFENIQEAIDKIRQYTLTDRFEVVLNNNLIESKEKLTNYRTILGCRISYDNLDKNISFIVKEDNKPTYEELENIIKEVREYLINTNYDSEIPNLMKILDKEVIKSE